MGTGAEVALIASAVAATAGTAYSIKQGEEQKAAAEDQKNQMMKDAEKKKKEAEAKQLQMETDANRDAQLGRIRAQQAARGAFGRSDTILTGPLGLPGGDQGQKKTLLGM